MSLGYAMEGWAVEVRERNELPRDDECWNSIARASERGDKNAKWSRGFSSSAWDSNIRCVADSMPMRVLMVVFRSTLTTVTIGTIVIGRTNVIGETATAILDKFGLEAKF